MVIILVIDYNYQRDYVLFYEVDIKHPLIISSVLNSIILVSSR